MRHTRAHTANRRAHHALKAAGTVLCAECGHPKLKHLACPNCGKYNKRVVVDVVARAERKEKRRKEREAVK
ncbi:MAG TPA: 50S ribosomal protein L32 [Candidatus Paceibacterota bacterium]|nr:50S ribosomal protein L32 [Candidatus Paceibacterota bacterium]